MDYGKKSIQEKEKGVNSNETKKKKNVKKLKIVLLVILAIFVIGLCVGFAFIKGLIDSAPDISEVDVAPSQLATTVLAADGTEVTKLVQTGSNRQYINISDIPDSVQKAFIAIEDERFYSHNGVDVQGIIRAFFVGVTNMKFSEGASTITQQLVKNNVLTSWTSETTFMDRLKRKIQEQYLAIQVEKKYSKEQILEYYLNSINLGSNCLGIRTAAKRYFDKEVSDLTISEAACIAAITQNPSGNNPITNPDKNKTRREKVLNNMYKLGYISQEQLTEAMEDDVYSRVLATSPVNTSLSTTSYFVDALIDQVVTKLKEEKGYSDTQALNAVYSGGLTIYSTQDLEIQKICDEEANDPKNYPSKVDYDLSYRLTVKSSDGSVHNYSENDMIAYFKQSNKKYSTIYRSQEKAAEDIAAFKAYIIKDGDVIPEGGEVIYYIPQPQTSITLMDQHTGEVKALVGGRGEKVGNMTLNRATQTTRQPGSCFKILAAYGPAIDSAGLTLGTAIEDCQYTYTNGREVHNWWGQSWEGYTTVRDAIAMSMNIIAVKTITSITPQLGYEYLLKFGITTLVDHKTLADGTVISDIGQPTALGGISMGVKNIELTAAFAAIANDGTYNEPILFTKILDAQGNLLIDNQPESRRVIKEQTAFLLTSAMQDVMTRGTAEAANIGNMPSAGKTGTTTDNYDIWLAAYTPYYTCAVWGGYDVNTELTNTAFNEWIWRKIMTRVHASLPRKEFSVPSGITQATICKKCGKLAVDGLCTADPRGDMTISEYFAEGTVPTETCSCHVEVEVCADTGELATEHCPNKTKKVFQVKQEGSKGGNADDEYLLPEGFLDKKCHTHTAAPVTPQPSVTPPSSSTPPGGNDNPGGGDPGGNPGDVGNPGGGNPGGGTPGGGSTP